MASSTMDCDPLEQRKTSRRAQRRKEKELQEDLSVNQAERNEDTKRGPSAEKERMIDKMVELRRQTMQQSATIASYDDQPEILGNYEYLDHTADIQLHGWGDCLERALEQLAIAMFGYMTSLSRIEINEQHSKEVAKDITITGLDMQNLAYSFLQEWLYIFHESGFVAKEMHVKPIDRQSLKTCSSGKGEIVDWSRHNQGTEIKAVTYSNLQVKEEAGRCDIWVIVDI